LSNHITLDKNDILLVVFSPGSAKTNVGRNGKLNVHLMPSCVKNFCTKKYIIIKFW